MYSAYVNMNASHVLLCMMLQKNDMSCGFGEEASKWTDGHLVGIYLFVWETDCLLRSAVGGANRKGNPYFLLPV